MSALEIITTAQTVRQTHQVYYQGDAKDVCTKKQFQQDTWYYQTYGGGPEGGFFVKRGLNEAGEHVVLGIWSVHRTWHQPFSVRKLSWTDSWFIPADEANNNIDTLVLEKPKKAYKPRAKKESTLDKVLQIPIKKEPAPQSIYGAYCTLLD